MERNKLEINVSKKLILFETFLLMTLVLIYSVLLYYADFTNVIVAGFGIMVITLIFIVIFNINFKIKLFNLISEIKKDDR